MHESLYSRFRYLASSKLSTDLIALYCSHAGRYLLPLLLLPYLARKLGPEALGVVAYMQAYGIFMSLLIEFGFAMSGTRSVAKNRNNPEVLSSILINAIVIQCLLSFFVVLVTFFIIPFLSPIALYQDVFWVAVWAYILQGFNLLWFMRGLEQMKLVAMIDFLMRLIVFVLTLALVSGPEDIAKVFYAIMLGNIISLLVPIAMLRRFMLFKLPSLTALWSTLKESCLLFFVRSSAIFFIEGNVFLLGFFLGSKQLGYFAGALRVANAIRGLIAPISDLVFPKMSRKVEESLSNAKVVARKAFFLMLLVGVFLTVASYIFSDDIIRLLLGGGFELAVPFFQIFCLFPVFIAINQALGANWLVPLGKDKYFSAVVIIGACINILFTIAAGYYFVNAAILAAFGMVAVQGGLGMAYYIIVIRLKISPFQNSKLL